MALFDDAQMLLSAVSCQPNYFIDPRTDLLPTRPCPPDGWNTFDYEDVVPEILEEWAHRVYHGTHPSQKNQGTETSTTVKDEDLRFLVGAINELIQAEKEAVEVLKEVSRSTNAIIKLFHEIHGRISMWETYRRCLKHGGDGWMTKLVNEVEVYNLWTDKPLEELKSSVMGLESVLRFKRACENLELVWAKALNRSASCEDLFEIYRNIPKK